MQKVQLSDLESLDVMKAAQRVVDWYDRKYKKDDEPIPIIDKLRKELAKCTGPVCPDCSGMGKREHDTGDERWVWVCETCGGSGKEPGGRAEGKPLRCFVSDERPDTLGR